MYAIVQTGGKQYLVQEGDVIKVEKLKANDGDIVELDVLSVSDDGNLNLQNENNDLKVSAKVLESGKSKKVTVFKYKAKKGYRRKKGHRQPFTKLEISSITV